MARFGDRVLFAVGALTGALGVGLSAVAAHVTGGNLATVATMLLAHGPVLLVLAGRQFGHVQTIGAWLLVGGLCLFCGDLAARTFLGWRLFPMAAPAGGMLLIAGWLVVGIAALFSRRGSA